jgi:hypothetical protein
MYLHTRSLLRSAAVITALAVSGCIAVPVGYPTPGYAGYPGYGQPTVYAAPGYAAAPPSYVHAPEDQQPYYVQPPPGSQPQTSYQQPSGYAPLDQQQSGYAPSQVQQAPVAAAYGTTCYAGFYTCALPQTLPVGAQCSCAGLGAPSYGSVR